MARSGWPGAWRAALVVGLVGCDKISGLSDLQVPKDTGEQAGSAGAAGAAGATSAVCEVDTEHPESCAYCVQTSCCDSARLCSDNNDCKLCLSGSAGAAGALTDAECESIGAYVTYRECVFGPASGGAGGACTGPCQ